MPGLYDLFSRYENRGGNWFIGTGGTDLSNAPLGQYGFPQWSGVMTPQGISRAAGFFQFIPGTWNPVAQRLGITDFSPQSQVAVFNDIYGRRGLADWTCPNCNPALTAEVARQGGADAYTNDLADHIGGGTSAVNQLTDQQQQELTQFGQSYDQWGNATWGGGGITYPDNTGFGKNTVPGNLDPQGYGVDAQGNPLGGGSQYQVMGGDSNPGSSSYLPSMATGGNSQYGGGVMAGDSNPGSSDTGGFTPIGDTGYARVDPQAPPVDTGVNVGAGDIQWNDPASGVGGAGAGGDAAGAAGGGQPVIDRSLIGTVKSAGQSIAQAISGPLSKATTAEGQDITKAAQTTSATGSGILSGAESWLGQAFVVVALFILGIVFVGVGLTKFGGGKQLIAHVKA